MDGEFEEEIVGMKKTSLLTDFTIQVVVGIFSLLSLLMILEMFLGKIRLRRNSSEISSI